MNQSLVSEMADENGVIDVSKPSLDVDLNIRQDDLRLFETETNRLLVTADEMDDGVYLEAIPSPTGVMTEVVVNPEAELTELTPADPAEQEVESSLSTLEVRMD